MLLGSEAEHSQLEIVTNDGLWGACRLPRREGAPEADLCDAWRLAQIAFSRSNHNVP